METSFSLPNSTPITEQNPKDTLGPGSTGSFTYGNSLIFNPSASPTGLAISNQYANANQYVPNSLYPETQPQFQNPQYPPGYGYPSQPQLSPNGNVPPSGVIPHLITNLTSLAVDEKLLKAMRYVNVACYSVLLISAPVVLIAYAVFLTKVVPPLDLFEVGNWWTFLVLFLSCLITILATGFAVVLTACTKGQLGFRLVTSINLALVVALALVMMVGIGVAETSEQKKGGLGGPKTKTVTGFGHYVISVCGNGTASVDNTSREVNSTLSTTTITSSSKKENRLDESKCTAIHTLRIGVFCMYIWTAELLIVIIIMGKFGLRSWGR